jgi:DNA-directed RNA polymerase specialized sigma24 family protein
VGKVGVEVRLSPTDAEELAGMFLLEFERAWPRIRSVGHYTRRMLRNNLRRYLRRKRELRRREAPYASHELDRIPDSALHVSESHPIERWGDDEAAQFAAVRETLSRTDPLTRDLMALRSGDPPLSYAVIAVRLNTTETALRMRAARFYQAVRDTHRAMAGPG